MKELWKRTALAALVVIFLVGMVSYSMTKRNDTRQKLQKEQMQESGLTLWYTDDSMTPYLTSAAVEFGKQNCTTVDVQLVSSSDYLSQIVNASVTESAVTPDLFIANNTLLEEVYEAGLAVENSSDKYTEKDFAKSALSSVTYHDKIIAYPLSFHTVCMVYRPDLIEQPANLECLLNYDVSQVSGAAIVKNIDFNTGNVLSDFVFLGDSTSLGGESGDNPEKIFVNSDRLIQGASFYYTMITSIGIVPYAMEDLMIWGYTENSNLSLLLSTDYLDEFFSKAAETGVKYELIKVPPLTENLPSKTGSYTDAVVVNGMGDKTLLAQQFAEFVTYDYVNNLYAKSRMYPARNVGDGIENFDKIYEVYKASESFPKFLETEDLSLKIGEIFADIANGSDINQAVLRFTNIIENRFKNTNQNK